MLYLDALIKRQIHELFGSYGTASSSINWIKTSRNVAGYYSQVISREEF